MVEFKVSSPKGESNYHIKLYRKFTYIRGNSATGKSELTTLVENYYQDKHITIISDLPVYVLPNALWKTVLKNTTNSIFILDEDATYYKTKEFAKVVKESNNYFLFINREDNPHLPYSYKDVYKFVPSGRYIKQVRMYEDYDDVTLQKQGYNIIVEDSNSGYQFFKNICINTKVISAQGKSNIINLILNTNNKNLLIIADGAAFGCEMMNINKLLKHGKALTLFLPESFEYILLHLNRFKCNNKLNSVYLSDYLGCYWNSWEQYFTYRLIQDTKATVFEYSKHTLNTIYLDAKILNELKLKFNILACLIEGEKYRDNNESSNISWDNE